MKRRVLAVLLCWGVSSSGAWAVDWSLNSTLSQSVELNDNAFMRTMLAGGTLSSYSTITTSAMARTPTSRFNIDADVSFQKYFGPGTEGIPQTESFNNGVHAHYETSGKNSGDREYLDATWRRQNTAFALLSNLGVQTNVGGSTESIGLSGGLDRALTSRDTVSLSARSSYSFFEPSGGGTSFTDTTVSGSWRRQVNPLTTLSLSSELERLDFSNSQNTVETISRNTAGIDAALTPLLSFRGTAGVVYVNVERGSSLLAPIVTSPTGSISTASGSASGFIGDALLTYKMLKDTTFTLSAGQTVSPSVVGSLVKLTTARAGVTRTINSKSTLSFYADASRQNTGSTTDFLSASVIYSYLLTREWNLQLSYRYLHRVASMGSTTASSLVFDPTTGVPIVTASGLGPASSNSVLMVLSRSFTILPPGN